jgi:hypothetical protein
MICSLNDANCLLVVTLRIVQARWAAGDVKM